MMTRLEMELQESRNLCVELMETLWRSNFAKWFADEERKNFLNWLSYLLNEIDEIANLVVSAKNLIRESKAIRAMLLDNGYHSHTPKLVQFISNESAIADELLLIQEMKDEKVSRIGELLMDYNDSLRQLLEMRTAGPGRLWMNLAGMPEIAYFPRQQNLYLLSEFYEEGYKTIRRLPAATKVSRYLSSGNGRR